jgi:hypothetical protein
MLFYCRKDIRYNQIINSTTRFKWTSLEMIELILVANLYYGAISYNSTNEFRFLIVFLVMLMRQG